jgi:hypothetical protein
MKLCNPAIFYFVLGVVSIFILLAAKEPVLILMTQLVFVLLWTWILNLICVNGFTHFSWFLVISPYVILLLYYAMNPKKIEKEAEKKESLVLI